MNANQTCILSIINVSLLKNATKHIKSNQIIFDTQSKIFSLLENAVRHKRIHLLLNYDKLWVHNSTDILCLNF